jgi:hypothetical protein
MSLEKKYLIVEYTIFKEIGTYLEKYGYKFAYKENGNNEKMKSIRFYFENITIQREIMFSYVPFDIRGEESEDTYFHIYCQFKLYLYHISLCMHG